MEKINSSERTIDWGDGKKLVVKKPNLSDLKAVVCPIECNPAEGDEKMINPQEKDKKKSNR